MGFSLVCVKLPKKKKTFFFFGEYKSDCLYHIIGFIFSEMVNQMEVGLNEINGTNSNSSNAETKEN